MTSAKFWDFPKITSHNRMEESRDPALALMHHLVLCGNEEDMMALLELLHSSPSLAMAAKSSPEVVGMKVEVLRVVIACLKDSHRARAIFRRVGGFVYIISVLVSLEGVLSGVPREESRGSRCLAEDKKVFALLRGVFTCLTTAMR